MLAMLETFEVVDVGLIEKSCLQAEFGQEQKVLINAFIIDLDIFVNLNSIFGVLDGLVVFS